MMWAFVMHDEQFQQPAQYQCKEAMENQQNFKYVMFL